MKQSLRERLEQMRFSMAKRIAQLNNHIEEYKDVNNFEAAMKCDIKRRQLIIVLKQIQEILD